MTTSYRELNDPRAIEWMELTRWIREYIASCITIQQFIEGFCDNTQQHSWIRRSLDASDTIAARKVVRGDDRYVNLYKQLKEIRSAIQNGIFIVRPITPVDVLKDVDINHLNEYFPLHSIGLSFNSDDNGKIDTIEYQVGDTKSDSKSDLKSDTKNLATIYLQLVEDCVDKMDKFILELSKIYVKALTARGFNGVLQIKNKRGRWWL